MHVIALVERLGHVCSRYRLTAYQPYWAQAGHSLEVREIPRTCWGWLNLSRQLGNADTVIWQRKLPRPWQLYLLRRAARILCFDFDDAVFLRDSYAARGLHSGRRRRRFAAMVQSADAVIAGNSYLADEAARWARSQKVFTIPTCLNPGSYCLADHQRTGSSVQLVWIGSSSTLRGLERARDLLDRVSQAHGISLQVVCDRFPQFRHLHVRPLPWSEAGEAAALASADIGISWVPNDLWSRGKCGLKLLQYMAAGLPVVANPVGVQVEIVRCGETGFLAETPDQWVDAVGRLARDSALRTRLGRAGRHLVEETYGTQGGADRWLTLLAGLKQRRQCA